MTDLGRKRIATGAQCAEVRRLAADGASVRRIAQEVFGDARFRGRVERIFALPVAIESPADDDATIVLGAPASAQTVPTVRAALARYLLRIERGEVQPSVGEMVKLLDLERRLQAFESIECLNALTRAPDVGDA